MDFLTNFMERLTKQSGSPAARTFNRQTRKIDRISVNNPETLGRYQVLPVNSAVTEFPFISGRVRQISLPRRRMDESGQEQAYIDPHIGSGASLAQDQVRADADHRNKGTADAQDLQERDTLLPLVRYGQ